MFKFISNSVYGCNCNPRRLQGVGDKVTCKTHDDAILNIGNLWTIGIRHCQKGCTPTDIYCDTDFAFTYFITYIAMTPFFVNPFHAEWFRYTNWIFDKEAFNVLKSIKNIYFITYFQFMSYFLVLFACILNLFWNKL